MWMAISIQLPIGNCTGNAHHAQHQYKRKYQSNYNFLHF